jgi:hypothetical protein
MVECVKLIDQAKDFIQAVCSECPVTERLYA